MLLLQNSVSVFAEISWRNVSIVLQTLDDLKVEWRNGQD